MIALHTSISIPNTQLVLLPEDNKCNVMLKVLAEVHVKANKFLLSFDKYSTDTSMI